MLLCCRSVILYSNSVASLPQKYEGDLPGRGVSGRKEKLPWGVGMKDILTNLMEKFRREHRLARRYTAMLLVLAFATTLFVNWQLHGVGISMTADYLCGYEEHEHTAECYERVLVCGYEEGMPEDPAAALPEDEMLDVDYGVDGDELSQEPEPLAEQPVHHHTQDCYEERQVLDCTEEEHEHTDECFDPEDGSLICELFPHTHTESCYTTQYELVCGMEEGEPEQAADPDFALYEEETTLPAAPEDVPEAAVSEEVPVHHHTEACYREELVCTLPEHHHTVECLSDPLADVETEADWLAKTNTSLTGNWGEDLLAVAQSQLDYAESTKNFKLDVEDEEKLRGWTRYGAWYGNPYGEWDVMFLSYCLYYAGIPQSVVPQRAGVDALRSDLRGTDWLLTDAVPQVGDALIYQNAAGVETVGIVKAVDGDTGMVTVISGAVEGTVAEVAVDPASITGVVSVTGAYAAQTAAMDPDAETEEAEKPEQDADIDEEFYPEDEDFSIVMTWDRTQKADSMDPLFAVAALEMGEGTDSVRLEDHITKVSLKKVVKGQEIDIDTGAEVKDGDIVKVALEFNFNSGVLTADRRQATYQLPGGLKLTTAVDNGAVKDGKGKTIGTYNINMDGLVTMTFNEDVIGGAHDGTLDYTAMANYSESASGSVNINNRFDLNISKPDPDLDVAKRLTGGRIWSDAEGNQLVQWQLEVSSAKGTDGQGVTIQDRLNVNNGVVPNNGVVSSYEPNSFVVKKRSGSTVETVDSSSYTFELDNTSLPVKTATVSGLPPLAENEAYLLEYVTKTPPGSFSPGHHVMYNQMSATAGDVTRERNEKITFQTPLEKTGTVNAEGLVEWTITLKAPKDIKGGFFANFTLKDKLPQNAALVGDITIIPAFGTSWTITADQLKNGYDLGEHYTGNEAAMPGKFTIKYTTTAVPDTSGNVVNTAILINKNNPVTFTATGTVPGVLGNWNITKSHVRTENNVAYWKINAANTAGARTFTLTDTILDATNSTGAAISGQNTHYAYAAELQTAIQSGMKLYALQDAAPLSYAQAIEKGWLDENSIQYYDAAGELVLASDTANPVMRFTVTVKAGDNDSPVRRILLENIPTHEARDKMQGGETWIFRNQAELNGAASTAQDGYRCYRRFEKMVATNAERNNYTGANSTIKLEDIHDGTLKYRIILTTGAEETAPITVTDKLPAGTFTSKGFWIDGQRASGITATYTVSADRVLTVNISNYNNGTPGKAQTIEFLYDIKISDDPAWKDPGTGSVSYTNEATWGRESSSITTTVTRDVTPLTKNGEQLRDETGWIGKIKYSVLINPGREKLGDGEWLTLRDSATVPDGAAFYGDLSTVRLYYYKYGSTVLEEVPADLYRKLDPEENNWLVMQVPDKTALLLEYVATIDRGNYVSPDVSNTITLQNGVSTSNKVSFQTNDSSATFTKGQLVINKLDGANGSLLAGAKFEVWRYHKETGQFEPYTTGTTGTNGQLVFDITNDAVDTLHPDVLYRLVETEAPTNYIMDSTPRYLLFYGKDSSKEAAFQAATGVADTLEVPVNGNTETVTLNGNLLTGGALSTTTLEVKNTYNQLAVHKHWFDKNTNLPLETARIPVKSLDVQLCRYTEGQSPDSAQPLEGEIKTLTAENGWSATWEGLPQTDDAGKKYYYMVKERTTGSWTVTEDNNGGIQLGVIVLKNYVYEGYQLPSTGGAGAVPPALGGAMMAAAAVLLYRRKKGAEREE